MNKLFNEKKKIQNFLLPFDFFFYSEERCCKILCTMKMMMKKRGKKRERLTAR